MLPSYFLFFCKTQLNCISDSTTTESLVESYDAYLQAYWHSQWHSCTAVISIAGTLAQRQIKVRHLSMDSVNQMSEIKTSSNDNANIAQPRKRTTSTGSSSYRNRSRSGSGSSSRSRTRSRWGSGISVFKDSSNSDRKTSLLDRPRPNSIAGQARSKSDGTLLFNNSSESTSISISSASSRPSIISRSKSIGSSSLPQNRTRTPSARSAWSFNHYH